ncbi:hypothetical protein GQ85_03470 [Rhodococcus rhodochrous]|nr:hypothetical protein GQ85_03470 [Rhodococcus rhodochrous]
MTRESKDAAAGRNWVDVVSTLITVAAAAVMLVMTIHIVANALLRRFFTMPIIGTNEYTTYWYMPIIAFLGIYLATVAGSHIDAPVLADRLPVRFQRDLAIFGGLVTSVIFASFAWFGFDNAMVAAQRKMQAASVDVAIWPVKFIVPVVCAACAVWSLIFAVRALRGRDLEASEFADGEKLEI